MFKIFNKANDDENLPPRDPKEAEKIAQVLVDTLSQDNAIEHLRAMGPTAAKASDVDGTTVLIHLASLKPERTELIKELLSMGARAVEENRDGHSALIKATQHGNVNIVKELITAGAAADEEHLEKALISAAHKGYNDIIDELIAAGANVNTPNHRYVATPLKAAINGRQFDTFRKLIALGAKFEDDPRSPALIGLAQSDNTVFLREVIALGASVNAATADGWTPLMMAALNGQHHDNVKELIKAGANVDAEGEYQRTALELAAGQGHTDIVRTLLKAGANVNGVTIPKGLGNPLVAAIEKGHTETAKELIKAGANVNAQNYGYSPITAAAYYQNLEVTKDLIAAGADVNVEDGHALEIVARNRNTAIARELIEAGVKKLDKASSIARDQGSWEIGQLIKQEWESRRYRGRSKINPSGQNTTPSDPAL